MEELNQVVQNPVMLVVSICAVLGMLLGLIGLIWAIVATGKARDAAASNTDAMTVMKSDWASFANKEKEERRGLEEKVERFQNETQAEWEGFSNRAEAFQQTTSDRVKEMERLAERTNEQIDRLEEYIRDFFDSELKSVFRSFDKTVGSVLGEMKSELLRGIKRIDEIQAVVDSKSLAQDRVSEGEQGARRFLTETTGKAVEEEAQATSPAEEAQPRLFDFQEATAADDRALEETSEEVSSIDERPESDVQTPPVDREEEKEEASSEDSVIAESMPPDESDAYETPTQDSGIPVEPFSGPAEEEPVEPDEREEPEDSEPPFRQAWAEDSDDEEPAISLDSEDASDDEEDQVASEGDESDSESDEDEDDKEPPAVG